MNRNLIELGHETFLRLTTYVSLLSGPSRCIKGEAIKLAPALKRGSLPSLKKVTT